MKSKLAEKARRVMSDCPLVENESHSLYNDYCDRHPFPVCKVQQILGKKMEFSKNVYAYFLKAPSRN